MKRFEIIDRPEEKRFNAINSFIFLSTVKTCYFRRRPSAGTSFDAVTEEALSYSLIKRNHSERF